jgi:hypothetical protein
VNPKAITKYNLLVAKILYFGEGTIPDNKGNIINGE